MCTAARSLLSATCVLTRSRDDDETYWPPHSPSWWWGASVLRAASPKRKAQPNMMPVVMVNFGWRDEVSIGAGSSGERPRPGSRTSRPRPSTRGRRSGLSVPSSVRQPSLCKGTLGVPHRGSPLIQGVPGLGKDVRLARAGRVGGGGHRLAIQGSRAAPSLSSARGAGSPVLRTGWAGFDSTSLREPGWIRRAAALAALRTAYSGMYQIGEVYARSWVVIGTSGPMVTPKRLAS
jgi:hypothetical protein